MKKHILGGSDRQQVCQPMLNPRLREESDLKNQINFISLSISIHAPVKRAIFRIQRRICILIFISIHDPVKGTTRAEAIHHSIVEISIHAPVKGATARSCTVLGKNYLSRKVNSSRISNFCLIFVYFLRESPAFF